MAWVSVTRLRLRAAWLLPVFVPHALRAAGQARRADGYLGGALLLDRKRAFWTMTVWRDATAMRGYVTADAHRSACRAGATKPAWRIGNSRVTISPHGSMPASR